MYKITKLINYIYPAGGNILLNRTLITGNLRAKAQNLEIRKRTKYFIHLTENIIMHSVKYV